MTVWPRLRDWMLRHPALALSLLTFAVLSPQLNKPFNMDDPLFIWAARHIQAHPGDPYGFEVNWYGTLSPMAEVTKNPPLACYYLSAVGSVAGWNEPALHAAMLLPALAVVLGTARLTRKMGLKGKDHGHRGQERERSGPIMAGIMVLFAPAFLVSSTTVMCDVLMLALWVWAVVFWVEGISDGSVSRCALAGVLVSLTELTKYYGIALIPLLLAYGWFKLRKPGKWCFALAIPVFVLVLYHFVMRGLYGRSLLADSVGYAALPQAAPAAVASKFSNMVVAMAFTGGGMAMGGFLVLTAFPRHIAICVVAGAVLFAVAAFSSGILLKDYGPIEGSSRLFIQAQIILWACGGLALLGLGTTHIARRQDADLWMLGLWIFGTFIFAAIFNWTVNGRSVLPLVPAAAILIVREMSVARHEGSTSSGLTVACVTAGIVIALLVMRADFTFARATRDSATQAFERHGHRDARFWFQGHWGFQYYMEQMGAKALDERSSDLRRGDIVAAPVNNVNYSPFKSDLVVLQEMIRVPLTFPRFLATMKGEVGAGFYAANRGPLPFAFGVVPDEEVAIIALDPRNGAPGAIH